MNTRTVDPRTAWAVLAMECALILPIISLPTQGDRLPGLIGPVLLLLLLPAGCAAVYVFPTLRDPSWRLMAGIGLALVTRAIVSTIPDEGLPGLLNWLARSFVPAAIGVALWWRGGALAVAELTPADVRTEFSVLAICLIVVLALIRPFLLTDQVLLGTAVGLFVVAGLMGMALSRQDAADITAPRLGRTLAIATALTPPIVAVVFVGFLRPELLNTMWLLLAHGIELLLTLIGLLLSWLGSLLPRGTPVQPPLPPPRPAPEAIPPGALTEAQERLAWVGTVIVITLLVVAGLATLLAVRLLLNNFIRAPQSWRMEQQGEEFIAESSGTPGEEASDLFGWIMHWLAALRARGQARAMHADRAGLAARDMWSIYQRLLTWAAGQGLSRQTAETTSQFSCRLAREVPEAAAAVDLVTRTFESERYGGVAAPADGLRRANEVMTAIVNQPDSR